MIADWTRVDRDYLFNWLQSPAFQNCVLGVSRSAQNGFNKGDLANLTFPLLDLASQKSLSRRLEAASNAGKAITRDAKHALALLDRLEQSILARAFRGELVPRDPSEAAAASAITDAAKPARGRQGRAA
jgi:type I restriction enzyme S subunit